MFRDGCNKFLAALVLANEFVAGKQLTGQVCMGPTKLLLGAPHSLLIHSNVERFCVFDDAKCSMWVGTFRFRATVVFNTFTTRPSTPCWALLFYVTNMS